MSIKKRYKLVGFSSRLCFVVVFAVLICQIAQYPVFGNESETDAESVRQSDTIKLAVQRGPILDRNGKILAYSKRVSSVYVDPMVVKDKNETAAKLAAILGLDTPRLLELISAKKRFVWIKRKLTEIELADIDGLKLEGVYTFGEYNRFYPCNELLCHVLGATDIDGNGIDGIEKTYDEKLTGKKQYLEVGEDGLLRQITDTNSTDIQPRDGFGIKLTIDKVVQEYVEEEIEDTYYSRKARSVMAIVMKVSTGEILAMANQPTFDANHEKYPTSPIRRNDCIATVFEPGSIMKPLIVGALFNNGIVASDDEINCHKGTYKIGNIVVHDAHAYGNLTVADIIVKSSNIGIAQLAAMIDKEKLYSFLTDMQFGDKFNLQFPGQISDNFRSLSSWTNDSVTSLSMGQGIMVTPLQITNAFCCIANGGELLQPQIVKAIVTNNGGKVVEEYNTPNVIRRVMTVNDTRGLLNPALVDVVNNGTGRKAKLKEYQIAGKTGTAEKIMLRDYIYKENDQSDKKFVASFVGYAPAENPEICVLVMVDEPNGKYYGGVVAAPVAGNIIKKTLDYHNGLIREQ